MTAEMTSKFKFIWNNIIFFSFTLLMAVVALPIYIYHHGVSASEIALFLFFWAATGLSITVGYHRLYAHRTFEVNKIANFLILFFGAAAFEQSALAWSSQHRDHHRYVDTDKDPYSIKKGFWYAHIGWLMFWEHKIDYDNAKDLQKNTLLMHQYKHYLWWAFGAGVGLPLLIGALTGHLLGAFLLSVCARLVFVHHSTFAINSVCHMFGKATYDIYSTAKDHWLVAFITNGEGYHNFHHRFPGDYRNGVRWYQWDPSKWSIILMEKIKWAHSLKRISQFEILKAQLDAEHLRAKDKLNANFHKELDLIKSRLESEHKKMLAHLHEWEQVSTRYYQTARLKAAELNKESLRILSENRAQAKLRFDQAYRRWTDYLSVGLYAPIAA